MKKILYALIGCLLFFTAEAQKNTTKTLKMEWTHFEGSQQNSAVQLAQNKSALRLSTNDDLQLLSVKNDDLGYRRYRYQQTYKGIPIEGSIYLLHEKANRTKKANGKLIRQINLNTSSGISEAAALAAALRYMGADLYAWEDATHQALIKQTEQCEDATFYPPGDLVIIDPEFGQNPDNYRLAYKFDIYAIQPHNRKIVYIDAQNSTVLTSIDRLHSCTDTPASGASNYSGTVDFTACQENGTHTLKSHTNGVFQQVFNTNNTSENPEIPFEDVDGFFDTDSSAVDVHFATQATCEYFSDKYSRNSLDDNGRPILSWVHYRNSYNNALWTGTYVVYGDGNGERFSALTAPDIVAHELMHGITNFSANLINWGESGALNESFSDIFGEVIEAYINDDNDWIIGADFTTEPGKNGIRNMRMPNDDLMLTRQPDTYQGTYWQTGLFDNGGVHFNSGVQNYWFYLLSEGGSGINDNGTPFNIEGIGMEKAAAIAYYNLINYMTSTSQYEDARAGAIQAAIDLYNADSDEVRQTEAAWCAVGLGDCGTPAPTCRLRDSLALVDFQATLTGNPWTQWDLTQPMDTWAGVRLNENQCVDSLVIKEGNLNGTLSLSIGNLSELKIFSLAENYISGTIPSTIGNLTNLTFLSLAENNFTGNIPPELGNLSNLEFLELSRNQLSGCYAENLKNLCDQLTSHPSSISSSNNFDASWEDFCSTNEGICFEDLPCPIRDSLALVDLYNSTNGQGWTVSWDLSAPVDTWVGVRRNIEGCVDSISIGVNQLSGTLPTSIKYLSELVHLGLGGNEIGGTILPEIGQLIKLTNLGLGGNNFTGGIPSEIGNLINLEQLWLGGNNNLGGSIPPQLGNLTNLTHFVLNDCGLTGSLPKELVGQTNIFYWRLFNNDLSGCYPSELAVICGRLRPGYNGDDQISDGNNFDASWEDFCSLGNGTCPPPTCREIDSLALVDFFHAANGNNWYASIRWDLNQPIDTWYGVTLNDNQCVDTLLIKEKDINGTLSPSIGNLSEIQLLSLPENNIGGSIPSSIGNLTNLTFLSLGDNNFTGIIPSQIGNLSNLTHLGLSHNALVGNIPSEIGNLTNLTLLALSHNQLSGCYADNLANLCNTLDTFSMTNLISNGNNFDASWEDFCNNNEGNCQAVWPGDFNNDGIVNNIDAIFWGFAAGNTGPVRPNATADWLTQPASEWQQDAADINGKYQDADGNGLVDTADLLVLVQNYGRTHSPPEYTNTSSPLQFAVRLLSTRIDSSGLFAHRFGIYLSASHNTSISAHGLAFSLDISDLPVIDTELDVSTSSLLPSESISVYDNNQKLHIGLTRTDKNNQIISIGDIVAEAIVVVKDVQSGDPFNVSIEGGGLASTNGIINPVSGTSYYGIFGESGIDIPISLSANVRHEQCNTPGSISIEALGAPPYTYTWNTGANTAEITHLTAGTYTVEVHDANGQQQNLSIEVDAAPPLYDQVGNEITCNSHISWLNPQLNVILEGAYDANTGMMSNYLKQYDLLPDIQPYANLPWNYNGQEGNGWTTESYPNDAVDWVLVSFRDAQNTNRIYAKTAAILRQDGNLFFPNNRFLSAEVADSIHLVIQHRNHIATMTPEPLLINNQLITYDFSLSDSYRTSASTGQKQLPDGTWVMLAGDCNAFDNTGYDINGQDKSMWSDYNGAFNDYFAPDLNLDGDINGQDKSLWFENNGLSSQIPK